MDEEHLLSRPLDWQLPAWSALTEALSKDHLAHGLLVYGQQGVGKLHFAKALGQFLLCAQPQNGQACGQCNGCLLNKAGTHPDLILVQPEETGKAIKVDQVRELNHFVSQTSQMSGKKVVIIEPADAMNINSSNALLKTLEEPSGDTHLILVVDSLSSLMATIRSRCQYYEIASPTREQAYRFLKNEYPDREDIDVLVNISEQGPFYAKEMIEQGKLEWRSILSQGLLDVCSGKSTIEVAESWKTIDTLEAFHWLDNWLRDMIVLVMTNDLSRVKNADLSELMHVIQARRVDPRYLHRYREVIAEMEEATIKSHPNKQLVYDRLLIDWNKMLGNL
ncbi:DNA polymerase III subunit delta' [Litoribrevibacter albus]|uniref:DNA polymerase III subunit delta' n=1 Tax=Litoribrevibacter albus TaxID=1473156 RepID=A0AA37SAF8_9GAMM|nr:DNA polymerase III subunit delta' [Litoribrevibacter albus]GLQ31689.1 DNA polymerase III subunit delta' [Litoribrevibacter albus]